MITTLTLSPCLDKTVTVGNFYLDRLNRAEEVRLDPGGKGINVSLALSALGEPSLALGLMFDGGETIAAALDSAGISHRFTHCPGRLRTNTKIYVRETKNTIELNEQNPAISEKSLDELKASLRKASLESGENGIFVLSGSVPTGASDGVYFDLISVIRRAAPSAKILLDCDGKALLKGLEGSPYMIKPNVEELERTFLRRIDSDETAVNVSREIIRKYGVGLVLVSKGSDGALAVTADEFYVMDALKISAKSAQGAGDAMVAGACLALSEGLSARDVLRYGTCAAAGAVELEGTAFCTRERFARLLDMAQ